MDCLAKLQILSTVQLQSRIESGHHGLFSYKVMLSSQHAFSRTLQLKSILITVQLQLQTTCSCILHLPSVGYWVKLQKEVKYTTTKKQPTCKKKGVAHAKKTAWKKLWNPRWQPRNGCDGRIMAKFNNSGEFGADS